MANNDILSINPCDIAQYIDDVKGIKSNSASPTDTLIIKFKNNVLYDDEKIEKGFLKVFITEVRDSKDNIINSNLYDNDSMIEGLLYEQKIYNLMRVIKKIKYCPYFVTTLLDGIRCETANKYLDIIKNVKFGDDKKNISESDAEKVVQRSLLYMLTTVKPRPAVDDNNDLGNILESWFIKLNKNNQDSFKKNKSDQMFIQEFMNNWNKTKINFIFTELQKGFSMKEYDRFYEKYQKRKDIVPINAEKLFFIIFFQILISLYGMEKIKLQHNDLHCGNIFINNVAPSYITYIIDDKVYHFNNFGVSIKIFDFDRAYYENFGENISNIKLTAKLAKSNFIFDNDFKKGKDLEIFLTTFLSHFSEDFFDEKMKDFSEIILTKNEEKDIFSDVQKILKNKMNIIDLLKKTQMKLSNFTDPYDKTKKMINVMDKKNWGKERKKNKIVKYNFKIDDEIAMKIKNFYIYTKPIYYKKIGYKQYEYLKNENMLNEIENVQIIKPSSDDRQKMKNLVLDEYQSTDSNDYEDIEEENVD